MQTKSFDDGSYIEISKKENEIQLSIITRDAAYPDNITMVSITIASDDFISLLKNEKILK